jgi:hypothetical protein
MCTVKRETNGLTEETAKLITSNFAITNERRNPIFGLSHPQEAVLGFIDKTDSARSAAQ